MALASVAAVAATRPRTDARGWSLVALALAGVEGLVLGMLGGDAVPLIAGIASLASAALIFRAR
jgi:glucose dehydrogenase